MKIVILLLLLMGLTFSLPVVSPSSTSGNPIPSEACCDKFAKCPVVTNKHLHDDVSTSIEVVPSDYLVNQFGRLLATSNSREILQLMQKYKSMGEIQQETQQRPKPGSGLPPAKLVPDQNPSTNLLPSEVNPFEWTFTNFPAISNLPQVPLELEGPNVQNYPAFNLLPFTHVPPMDTNSLAILLGALLASQTLPATNNGMTGPQQLLPSQQMLPIVFTQMGQQGAVLSSEEMQPLPHMVGVLIPGLFPSSQAVALPEGQEGLLPAGQAIPNLVNQFPEGTAAGIQKISPTTNDGLNEAASEPYPTPSGFRQAAVMTNMVFVEPTASINMEPSELREPPTSPTRLAKDNTEKAPSMPGLLVRGDSYMPISTMETKPLKEP